MNLFGKKKPKEKPVESSRIPAGSRIAQLSSDGVSEPEIIRTLRSEGYTPMEVDSAMKTALRSAAGGEPPTDARAQAYSQQPPPGNQWQEPQEQGMPAPPGPDDRRRIFPEENMPNQGMDSPPPLPTSLDDMKPSGGLPDLPGDDTGDGLDDMDQRPVQKSDFVIPGINEQRPVEGLGRRKETRADSRREMEELAEMIFEEKADMFRKEIDSFSDQIHRMESKLHLLEERFHGLEGKKKSEMSEIKSSLQSYEDTIEEISARMGSVERAVKDSMAPMMQTMRSMSDMIKEIKGAK